MSLKPSKTKRVQNKENQEQSDSIEPKNKPIEKKLIPKPAPLAPKLKIPSAYIPDHWVCDHKKKKHELNADLLVVIPKRRKQIEIKKSLKPFLTGIHRASPFKDTERKCDWRCDHAKKKCARQLDSTLLNAPATKPVISVHVAHNNKKPNESWSELKTDRTALNESKISSRSKSSKRKPLKSSKSASKGKTRQVFNKTKLDFKKKLTSAKNKCLNLKNKNATNKKNESKKSAKKIVASSRRPGDKRKLLDDEYNTIVSNVSNCLYGSTFENDSSMETSKLLKVRVNKLKSKSERIFSAGFVRVLKKSLSEPFHLYRRKLSHGCNDKNEADFSFNPNINNCSSIKNLETDKELKNGPSLPPRQANKKIRKPRRYSLAGLEDLKQLRELLNAHKSNSFIYIDKQNPFNENPPANIQTTTETNHNEADSLKASLKKTVIDLPVSMVKFTIPLGEMTSKIFKLRRANSDTDFFRHKALLNGISNNQPQFDQNYSTNLQKFFNAMENKVVNSSFLNETNTHNNSSVKPDKFDEMEADWIESGKTKFGLQFERLFRRYKKLSKQKRYLVFFIIILTFFTTISLLIIILLLLSTPRTHLIYLNSEVNSNGTTSSRYPSTAFLKSAVNKTTGLVGDLCLKVVGDCEKYMECRKHDHLVSNISSCQCVAGYVADANRNCRGLSNSYCEKSNDCSRNLACNLQEKKCVCKEGYHPRPDKTCFAKYNSACETDRDCLKNGECRSIRVNSDLKNETARSSQSSTWLKVCQCNSKERTLYKPEYEPYRQCRLLIGAKCEENLDCIENARCNKYCSCREIDLYFETENFLCEDGCRNKNELTANSVATKFPHPRKCGYYFTCMPRDLDVCPSNYIFDAKSQSCSSTALCR